MDIWRWVNDAEEELRRSGRERLAELIEIIPGYVVNHKHAQLDAVVPEALALAREAKNPWLEVFIRHWNLQSRILHRHEVKAFLPEAARLIELASRPEARECPQSVCVTQDLAGCYAKIDGPGYVEERLSVARETLGRIDARWPCFTCIASEYALALIDRGCAEQALLFMDQKAAELAAVGRARAAHHLAGGRIEALLRLGRIEEMLTLARAAKDHATDDNDRVSHAIDCAAALARLGQHEEAKKELPAFERVVGTHSLYERWSQAVTTLALAGASLGGAEAESGAIENGWKLDAQLFELQDRLRDNGVVRMSADIAERRARLALGRGRTATAAACVEEIQAILPDLRAPAEVERALSALKLDLALAQAREAPSARRPPDSAEEVIARLTDDPEVDLALIREALVSLPGDERLSLIEAAALRALGRSAAADARLRAFLAEHPGSSACLLTLGQGLLDRGEHAAARELARGVLAREPGVEVEAAARWILALSHRLSSEIDRAIEHLERILVIKPDSADVELLLGALHRDAGHLEEALARLDRLIERGAAPGNADWDRMVVATLLERWDKVRESARRLGMDIAGEGPIDEAWSICRIEILEEGGEATVHHALRTGPVTARIIEVSRPRTPQHYGDEVVFEATPKNPPPPPGEERGHIHLYPAIKVRRGGGYQAFLLDGVHPGEEALAVLKEALKAEGVVLSVRSDDSYELQAPDGGEPLLGLFAYLAAPEAMPALALHALLSRLTASYAHPVVWPGLAQAMELEEELTRQAEIIERYGL